MVSAPAAAPLEVDLGADKEAIERYREEGTKRALAMDNRGPLVLDENGRLSQDILDKYNKYGVYIFEGVLGEDELADMEADLLKLL